MCVCACVRTGTSMCMFNMFNPVQSLFSSWFNIDLKYPSLLCKSKGWNDTTILIGVTQRVDTQAALRVPWHNKYTTTTGSRPTTLQHHTKNRIFTPLNHRIHSQPHAMGYMIASRIQQCIQCPFST